MPLFVSALNLFLTLLVNAAEYDFTAVKSILNGYVEEGKLVGSVVLVLKDGETVLHYATGKQDIASGKPMQANSMFRITSQTKVLTSVAVLPSLVTE